jgi:hypothetical protein
LLHRDSQTDSGISATDRLTGDHTDWHAELSHAIEDASPEPGFESPTVARGLVPTPTSLAANRSELAIALLHCERRRPCQLGALARWNQEARHRATALLCAVGDRFMDGSVS